MKKFEHIAALLSLVALITAWVIGKNKNQIDLQPYIYNIQPAADSIDQHSDHIYQYWQSEGQSKTIIGYAVIGKSDGHGGPMRIVVGFDTAGQIFKIGVIDHKETIAFFQKIEAKGLPEKLLGKSYRDSMRIGRDFDGISGATQSSRAFITAISSAGREFAENIKHISLPPVEQPKFVFTAREIALIFLFLLTFIIHRNQLHHRKKLRWFSLILSLIVLGFMYAALMTLSIIIAFILGFWPDWRLNIYWYILFVIVFLPIILQGKNFYCKSICPFGAAQECLGAVGKAKQRIPQAVHDKLIWLPRGLAFILILIALISQNPGLETHEVFGTFFHLTGSNFQFILMAVVLITSLFISRPWCTYLCPIRGVTDFIRYIRLWIKNSFYRLINSADGSRKKEEDIIDNIAR